MSVWVKEIIKQIPGQSVHCRGVIPVNLEVFQDHFPEFPVLPGVLALDILRESVDLCWSSGRNIKGPAGPLKGLKAVKFQHFLKPGEAWESHASYSPGEPQGSWSVKLIVQDRTAVSARMLF